MKDNEIAWRKKKKLQNSPTVGHGMRPVPGKDKILV
jgi:hypothetical protein